MMRLLTREAPLAFVAATAAAFLAQRTHLLQGVVHLILFGAYVMLIFAP